jgi:hypothetical protein
MNFEEIILIILFYYKIVMSQNFLTIILHKKI